MESTMTKVTVMSLRYLFGFLHLHSRNKVWRKNVATPPQFNVMKIVPVGTTERNRRYSQSVPILCIKVVAVLNPEEKCLQYLVVELFRHTSSRRHRAARIVVFQDFRFCTRKEATASRLSHCSRRGPNLMHHPKIGRPDLDPFNHCT